MKFVIVTTAHRGVFAGYTDDASGETVTLKDAKMAIYWGTTKGLMQLAHTGPTSTSKISAPAPEVELRNVTAVFSVTPESEEVWRKS